MVEQKKYKAYNTIPVYAPTLGLAGHVPPTMLKNQYAADCLNVRFKNGEVRKRTGYVDYGTGTITGIPMGFYCYRTWDGMERVILVTTTNVYQLVAGAWVSLAGDLIGSVDTRCSMCTIQNTMIFANSRGVAKKLSITVDVGSACIDRTDNASGNGTFIDLANPANAAGKITSVAIWANVTMASAKVATFYRPDPGGFPNNFTARDVSGNLGVVTGGSVQNFAVDLDAEEGDFIGIYFTDAADMIEVDRSGGSGCYYKDGDQTTCDDTAFTLNASWAMSLYGSGTGVGAGNLIDVENATDYEPSIVLPYGERLVMFNIIESDIPVPIRIRWSAAGTFETWTGTGSSFFDVTDGMGAKIVGAELIGNYVGVYKDYSISLMDYIAGASIFAIDVHINNMGLAARSAIVNLHTLHVFLGWDNVYAWNGGWKLQEIGNPIKDELFGEINNSKIGRSFMLHCPREHEIHLFVCIGTDNYPTRFWTYRYTLEEGEIKGVWSKGLLASISGAGSITSGGVERALLGLSGGGIEHYDYDTVNDDGVKIDGWFETSDFPVSEEEYILEREMFSGFSAEAYGDTIILSYSVDGGNSYTDMTAKTLQSTSLYKLEDWYFKKHGQQIRFKLRNNVISERFRFRFYGIKVIPREAHK